MIGDIVGWGKEKRIIFFYQETHAPSHPLSVYDSSPGPRKELMYDSSPGPSIINVYYPFIIPSSDSCILLSILRQQVLLDPSLPSSDSCILIAILRHQVLLDPSSSLTTDSCILDLLRHQVLLDPSHITSSSYPYIIHITSASLTRPVPSRHKLWWALIVWFLALHQHRLCGKRHVPRF
jgi:hypothetical protein